jgi:predicted Zn-dependent peptidase
LAQVTPEDVQRVAQTYLQTRNRVVGVYLPEASATPQDEESDSE